MKNQMKVLLRGGVLMLAAVFAFAFTEPMSGSETVWGKESPEALPIAVELGSNEYNCNLEITETCIYSNPQATTPHPQSPNGRFVYMGSKK
ncbi:hypothetical protein [Rhodonellum sp.]|uniref:hypothetical protein n=1 Tax=Rhodonellum sp. TaxID=2231180 RepID=UPI00271A98E1|nr:hypothetical protein [Rhodonellum sp.]MDO9553269.1 hypothetical protein [Rhodonellum sp.]